MKLEDFMKLEDDDDLQLDKSHKRLQFNNQRPIPNDSPAISRNITLIIC